MRHPLLSRHVLLGCFILLQSVDLLLTWFLVGSGVRNDVYEANPLALSVLSQFGWAGLAVYKAIFTAVAAGAVLLLWQRRVASAQRLAGVMCLAMFTVVCYSGYLAARPTDPEAEAIPALRAHGSAIAYQIDHLHRFVSRRSDICRDLLDGKIGTEEALDRLQEAVQSASSHLAWRYRTQIPDGDRTAELASYLYHYTSRLVRENVAGNPRLARLRKELRGSYPDVRFIGGHDENGRPVPWRPGPVNAVGYQGT